jgi:hypothetical protein
MPGMGGMGGMPGMGGMGGMPGMGGMGGMGDFANMMGGGMAMPGMGGMGMDEFDDESDDEGWCSCTCSQFQIMLDMFLSYRIAETCSVTYPN